MEEIDVESATKRVQRILHRPVAVQVADGQMHVNDPHDLSAGKPSRKRRSDFGTTKPKPPVDPDEITLKLSLDTARHIALKIGGLDGVEIQNQIIAQLQKKLAQLSR